MPYADTIDSIDPINPMDAFFLWWGGVDFIGGTNYRIDAIRCHEI
jgi:hypothetical protein